MKNITPKIYRMNDFDTVIAYSKREAINWYFENSETGDSKEEIAIECERETDLTEGYWWNCHYPEDLWERANKLNEYKQEEIRVSKWAGDPAYWVTFQYVIDNLLDKLEIPGIICTTEY